MNRTILAAFIFFLFAYSFVISQDTTSSTTKFSDDFTEEWEFISFSKNRNIQPRIDLNYGFTELSHHQDVFGGEFSSNNTFELRLGFDKSKPYYGNDVVYKIDYNYILLSNTSELSTKRKDEDFSKVRTESWRFGLGGTNGFGYKFSDNISLGLGEGNSIVWNKISLKDSLTDPKDKAQFDYIGDGFRFGAQTEANINLKFADFIGVNVGYERTAIFPRHLFWYWAGSEIIRSAGSGLVGVFVREVGKSSPEAVPVVNFILKNALNYGFYELRKKNMNWPFDTEPPLMYDNFKIGINFNF